MQIGLRNNIRLIRFAFIEVSFVYCFFSVFYMLYAVDKMMSLQDLIDSYVNGIIDRSQGVCSNDDTLAIHSYIYILINNGHSFCKYRTYSTSNFKNLLLLHIFEQNCPEEVMCLY